MTFQSIQFGTKLARVETAIAEMDAAIAQGITFKANFDRIKSPIENAVETAWKNSVIEMILSNRADWNDAITDLYYASYPTAHAIKVTAKRVEAVAKTGRFNEVVSVARAFIADIAPVYERIETLKGLIKKRETKAETAAREAAYKPLPVSTAAQEAIRAKLTEIAEAARTDLENHFASYDRRVLNAYLSADLAYTADLASKPTFYKTPRAFFSRGRVATAYEVEVASTVERYLNRTDRSTKPTAMADAEQRIVKNAKANADAVVRHFISKNLKKLVSIIDAKGNYESAELIGDRIQGGGVQGSIKVTFTDGSSFIVNNTVVFVQNQQGTQFNRFPLTFHNVVLPNGTSLKSPSEKKMNEVFAA